MFAVASCENNEQNEMKMHSLFPSVSMLGRLEGSIERHCLAPSSSRTVLPAMIAGRHPYLLS